MRPRSSRLQAWSATAGLAACLLFGWFSFVRGTRVPLLGLVDLGFHELGHLVTHPLPDIVTAVMGSVTQVLVPVGLALYFLLVTHDLVGAGVCSAWAATSAVDVSYYIADAPYERLPLIGGLHDWAFVLGPDHLDMLGSAHTIAVGVKGVGFALLIAGFACCALALSRGLRTLRVATAPPRPADALDMWR
jgi:hypothetical protein